MRKALFKRRLLIVTGKGGVGKTTVASAIAVAAKERGLRTLLVEVGVTENIPQIFRKPLPVYTITPIEDGLWGLRLDPFRALQEYLALNMKVEWAAKKFLETDVIRYLTQAAPGWRELITLGKIWKLEQERSGSGRRSAWDLIVVDAPATGHGISFLRAPKVILDTFKYGPIRYQTQEVQKLLLDPDRTLLNVVTLPEEMPINETIEIHRVAKKTLLIPFGCVFVNMMPPRIFGDGLGATLDKLRADKASLKTLDKRFPGGSERLFTAADNHITRRRLAEGYVGAGREHIDAEFVELPDLYREAVLRDDLAVLARHIADVCE